MSDRPVVFICSPFAGDIEANVAYAREAMLDSLARGEAPYAPHLLYPQVLDDNDTVGRRAGMNAGKTILARCDVLAVYLDRGESSGMRSEISFAVERGIAIDRRWIGQEIEAGQPSEVDDPDATPRDGHVVDLDQAPFNRD